MPRPKMIEREYRVEDEQAVRSLYERSCDFPMIDLDSPLCLAKTVVECEGKIVGFGCLRLTSEAIIMVDKQSPQTQAITVQRLIQTGVVSCQKLGLQDMHAFLTGSGQEEFERFLKKHYGFAGHRGPVLVLEV